MKYSASQAVAISQGLPGTLQGSPRAAGKVILVLAHPHRSAKPELPEYRLGGVRHPRVPRRKIRQSRECQKADINHIVEFISIPLPGT